MALSRNAKRVVREMMQLTGRKLNDCLRELVQAGEIVRVDDEWRVKPLSDETNPKT